MMKKKELLFLFIIILLLVLGLAFKHFISASIFDTYNFAWETSVNITVVSDTTPPDLIIVSPTEGTTYTSTSINLEYSVSDPSPGVDSIWYNLNNGANNTLTTNTTFTVAGNGNYVLYMFAKDRSGNENGTESVSFTVNVPTTPGPTGQTAGGEGGGGGGKKISFPEFKVTPELIKVKLKQGGTESQKITIENTGESLLEFVIDPAEIKRFVTLSDYAFELGLQQSKEITAVFTASSTEMPDVYAGRIFVRTKELVKNIITVIEVESREPLFDVNMSIPLDYKKIIAGGSITGNIVVVNVGDTLLSDVGIDYIIKDLDGNIVDMQHETVAVKDMLSITRKVETLNDMALGDYIFYVKVRYNGNIATASDLFSIIGFEEKRPSWLAQQLSKVSYSRFFIVVISLMLITVLIILIRKKRKKKTKKPSKRKFKEKPFKEEALKEKSELKKLVDHIRNNLK